MKPDELIEEKFKEVAVSEQAGELLFRHKDALKVIEEIEKSQFIILGLDFWKSVDNDYMEINSTAWDDINSGENASSLTVQAAKRLLKNGIPDDADFVSFVVSGKYVAKGLLQDHTAPPSKPGQPYFIREKNEKVYTGFPLIPETETDGFTFGAISNFLEPDSREGCTTGDGYVQAPNGSRAGIIWQVYPNKEKKVTVSIEPDEKRWGVYNVGFPKPIKSINDLVYNFRETLPLIKEIYKNLKTTTDEKNFWNWFCANSDNYYLNLEKDQDHLLSELSRHMHIGDFDFAFMLSPIDKKTKKRTFIISANDYKGLIPYVKKIVKEAPLNKLADKWEIQAFYQREKLPKTLDFSETSLSTSDIYFLEYKLGDGVGLNLYIKFDLKQQLLKGAISLLLCAAIGEYDLLTYVKKIDVFRFKQENVKNAKPLKKLPKIIDEIKNV